ncbi:uncharacterized protein MELLADRAFT_63343 [Melampsora larici-populina 98AG31]|uniref:Secreted protein n=1 Tax=Melampsora larici-populina (strain 98AG31 / pathotype 3-4-7) TaxID=747676 RepID=F4RMB6_MELLP|nr:uncharacterized protein MELLADRAFT_63343 [Melampsora larici-populina 98AG31]EGG06398.1 hypothetical protein MELLADRAFT_63343 [Melampsora larici-populina 98AG31]
MKPIQTTVLIFNWPMLLSAMGVWDLSELSNTIGLPVATTESHVGALSHLSKPKPHDTSSQPSVSSHILPVADEQPLETLTNSFDHLEITQPVFPNSEAYHESERFSYFGLQGSSSTSNPLLQDSTSASLVNEEPRKRAPVPLLESGLLKRPANTHEEFEYQPSRKKLLRGPTSFDIGQVEKYPPSVYTDFHTSDSSTRPNQQPSTLQFKPLPSSALDSEMHHDFNLEELRFEPNIANIPFDIENQQSTLAIQRYYGKAWPQEKQNKEKLRNKHFEGNLDQKLVPNSNHQLDSPRALIDRIQREFESSSDSLPMNEVLDNYLDILTICSEVISSNGIPTNMEKDVRDGYKWLKEEFKRGLQISYQKQSGGFKSIVHRSYWLGNRSYKTNYEIMAAKYVLEFMRQERDHWIEHLTPRIARELLARTLLISAKRVRPLKYSGGPGRIS